MEEMTRSHDTCADSSLGVGVVSEAGSEGHPRLLTQASNAVTFASDFGETGAGGTTRLCDWSDPVHFGNGIGGEDSSGTCPLPGGHTARYRLPRRLQHICRRCCASTATPVAFCELTRWCLVDDCAHERPCHTERRAKLSFQASSACPAVPITTADRV